RIANLTENDSHLMSLESQRLKRDATLIPAIIPREDCVAIDSHWKLRDGLVRWRAQYSAGAHIETGARPRALRFVAVQFACRQVAAVVRADVLDRIQLAIDVEHGDGDIAVPSHPVFTGQQFGPRTNAHPVIHFASFLASGA